MGNVVFAVPTIARFRLHAALGQQLTRRGHRVEVLSADPVTHRFHAAQGMRARLLPVNAAGIELRGLPLTEAGRRDCALAGTSSRAQLHRACDRIARYVPGLLRFFSTESPDLVLVHGERTGLHRLIAFVAKEFGCHVLHTGDGLLPGTMQCDDDGIDGDSSIARRTRGDYARHARDEMFLMAALAAVLGGSAAPPVALDAVVAPRLPSRLAAIVAALRRRQLGPAYRGLGAWRRALPHAGTTPHGESPPAGPFVAAVLQDPAAPCVRIDAPDAPDPLHVVLAARAATWAIDSSIPIVAVPPRDGLPRATVAAIRRRVPDVRIVGTGDRMTAIATALAAITINEPHALAAVLAGTPLLHLGAALWEHAGVSTRSTLDTLHADLARVLGEPGFPHRESYLTRALVYDHLWCDADEPDENGVRGLAKSIEDRFARAEHVPQPLEYRAGMWPLHTIGEE